MYIILLSFKSKLKWFFLFIFFFLVERNERIIVPAVLERCEIPEPLRSMAKIDFTNKHSQKWTLENLVLALLPEDGIIIFLSSLGRGPLNDMNMISSSV